jgi:hypothetical protein
MIDIKLEQNPKLGFYTVGDKVFYTKPQALIEATNTGHFPHWNFNNEVFGKQSWLEDPEIDLQELYRLRAVQLREKYDYIRMEVSGGADGSVALYAFLLNGIHVDEIVFRYPKAGEKNVTADPYNTKAQNTLSEYQYAAKPMLDWVKTNYPKVKITMHDYSLDMLAGGYDETWVFQSKDYFQPGHTFKHNPLGMIEHRLQADSGKKICVLYGIDKPKICIKEGKWYLYFLDIQANCSVGVVEDYTNITNEYFYWTPDMPDIVRKQAHMIKNWFSMPQNTHLQYLIRWPNHNFAQRTTYEALIKPVIYPTYDSYTWQTAKPTNSFYNEMDHWFYENFQGTESYKIWEGGLELLVNNIDNKFFNKEGGRPVGFVGFLSPFYCVGDAVPTNKTKKFSIAIPDRF